MFKKLEIHSSQVFLTHLHYTCEFSEALNKLKFAVCENESKKHLQLAYPQAKQARNLAFVTSLMLKTAIFQRSISPEIFELHLKYFTGM